MLFTRKPIAEVSGHDLLQEFEAFIDAHEAEVSQRVAVVKSRLAELESEKMSLTTVLAKLGQTKTPEPKQSK